MGFSKETYRKALEIKKQSRQKAEAEAARRREKIYAGCSRLEEIDGALAAAGAKIAVTALSPGGKEALPRLREYCTRLEEEKRELLQAAGIGADAFLPGYACKTCCDTGYVGNRLCGCVHALAKELTYHHLCGEMPLAESTFESFDLSFYPNEAEGGSIAPRRRMKQILEFCETYASGFSEHSPNLLFCGVTGLGKTHLSLAIAGAAIRKGCGVVYGPTQNLLGQVEKEHFSREETTDALDGILTCDLLILDDFGTEFITPFALSTVYTIINSRILSGRPTIINTNLSLKELEEKYTPRVTSRLIGNYTIKQFLGRDIRQLKVTGRI